MRAKDLDLHVCDTFGWWGGLVYRSCMGAYSFSRNTRRWSAPEYSDITLSMKSKSSKLPLNGLSVSKGNNASMLLTCSQTASQRPFSYSMGPRILQHRWDQNLELLSGSPTPSSTSTAWVKVSKGTAQWTTLITSNVDA